MKVGQPKASIFALKCSKSQLNQTQLHYHKTKLEVDLMTLYLLHAVNIRDSLQLHR